MRGLGVLLELRAGANCFGYEGGVYNIGRSWTLCEDRLT
jgi:hypothetical protein